MTYMEGGAAGLGGVHLPAGSGEASNDLYLKHPISGTEGITVTSRP